MKKIINNIFAILVIFFSFINSTNAYVRKKVQPNYFVPQADVSTGHKYAMPKYGRAAPNTVNKRIRNNSKYSSGYQPVNNQINNDVYVNESQNPAYQNKFQEYLKDVDKIKEKGYVADSRALKNDLSKMNSDQRIRVDQEFNKSRNVEGAIDSLMK